MRKSNTGRMLCITSMVIGSLSRKSQCGTCKPHNSLPFSTVVASKQTNLKETSIFGLVKQIEKTHRPSSENNGYITTRLLRGGACSDSNPTLFLKIAISAALETTLMTGLIVLCHNMAAKYPDKIPNLFSLSMTTWLSLIAIIFASSFFGSIIDGGLSAATRQVLDPNTIAGDADWFDNLIKPSWNPPGWLFPIMWLIVSKPTQLLAVSTLLKSSSNKLPLEILIVYFAHLSLGDAWNKVFFGLQCTGRGAAVISIFYGMLLLSAYLFSTVDQTAGLLMLPTCAWVTVAASLNWNIYLANKN